MAPEGVAAAGAVTGAADAARLDAIEEIEDEDDEAAVIPVRVPAAAAEEFADAALAEVIAARLSATGFVLDVVPVDGTALVVEELVVVLVVEFAVPLSADAVLEVTIWPPEVAKTEAAPLTAEGGTDGVDAAGAEAATGAVVVVLPSAGTAAAAPVVVLALM